MLNIPADGEFFDTLYNVVAPPPTFVNVRVKKWLVGSLPMSLITVGLILAFETLLYTVVKMCTRRFFNLVRREQTRFRDF